MAGPDGGASTGARRPRAARELLLFRPGPRPLGKPSQISPISPISPISQTSFISFGLGLVLSLCPLQSEPHTLRDLPNLPHPSMTFDCQPSCARTDTWPSHGLSASRLVAQARRANAPWIFGSSSSFSNYSPGDERSEGDSRGDSRRERDDDRPTNLTLWVGTWNAGERRLDSDQVRAMPSSPHTSLGGMPSSPHTSLGGMPSSPHTSLGGMPTSPYIPWCHALLTSHFPWWHALSTSHLPWCHVAGLR